MFDLLDLMFESNNVFVLLVLHDQHCDRACPEVIHQDILSLNSLNAVRQIGQNIVIHTCVQISPYGRNHKDQGQSHDQVSAFDHHIAKTLHNQMNSPFLSLQTSIKKRTEYENIQSFDAVQI